MGKVGEERLEKPKASTANVGIFIEKASRYTAIDRLTPELLRLCLMCSVTALATDDPLTVVNNLSSFIFSLIKAIGMIILAFGIVQVGLSLKSHDASQRATGFLTVAGGIIICFAKEILDLITG